MGHQSAIITLAWDPSNSNRLATAGDDKTIGIWDMRTKRPTQFLSIGEPIISVSWSPDGLQLAACDKKDRISLIDTRTFTTTYTSPPFDYEVEEVMFLPSYPQYLMFPTSTGAIRIFDVVELKEKPPLRGHTSNVYCMDVAKGGKYVAAGSADAISSIWDMEEMMYKTSIHGIRSAVRAVSFSHDSQLLASGLEDGSVDVSSVEFGETVHIIQGKGNVNTCAWHPDKLWLAYAGDDAAVDKKGMVHVMMA
jgi:THO complex subunit 3